MKRSRHRKKPRQPHPERWQAWTDGSCWPNPGPASVGVVLLSPEGERTTFSLAIGHATNNYAELMAIGLAIKLVPPGASITVNCDSTYAVGMSRGSWHPTLRFRKNGELIAAIRLEAAKRHVQFNWVRGHNGNAMNELADMLATQARLSAA